MRDPGPPTLAARLTVAGLAIMALGVGALWMWTTATGMMVAGVPPWAVGLVVVALLVGLAFSVHKMHDPRS